MRLSVKKIERRSAWAAPASMAMSVLAALLVGGVLLTFVGVNPLAAYEAMFRGAFGDQLAVTETLVKATPLMLTGLGVALALRAGFWNIGAEGQLVMGGFAATGMALFWGNGLPGALVLPAMILAGFLGGALWGLIPALLKVFTNVSEIVSTLMLNYIAVLWIEYLYFDAWRDPRGFGFPGTAPLPDAARLPRLMGRLHIGILLALAACVVLWFLLARTRWGYEIRVVGASVQTARYAGMDLRRSLFLVMALSGGLAGLAGMGEVAGISYRLQNGLAVGYGYTALIIAFLARLNVWGVVAAAVFMAGLTVGSDQLQIALSLPASFAWILQGTVLLFILAGGVLTHYRVRLHLAAEAVHTERQTGQQTWT